MALSYIRVWGRFPATLQDGSATTLTHACEVYLANEEQALETGRPLIMNWAKDYFTQNPNRRAEIAALDIEHPEWGTERGILWNCDALD